MKRKYVIITILVIVFVAILIWPTDDFKISSVEDSNLVVLNNGTRVRLIGLTSTLEGKQYIYDNYVGNPVSIISDRSAPFNPKHLQGKETVYAYLVNKHGVCINSDLLRIGVVGLQEGVYLTDSLRKYRQYALIYGENQREEHLTPTPAPKIDYEEDDIKLPEYEFVKNRRHSNWYTDGTQNIEMLKEACDFDLPYTKAFANDLAGRSPGNFNPGQICEIFDYCYSKWRYVNDPNGQEYVAKASESIACNLSGDCDDFAVLMASCLLAVGGDVCINTGFNATEGHAFTEVDISQFDKSVVLDIIRSHFYQYDVKMLNVRDEDGHRWLNMDWQAAYPGGAYYSCTSRDAYSCVRGEWCWKKLK